MASDYVLIAEPDARLARTFEAIANEARLSSLVARDGAEAKSLLQRHGIPAALVTNLVLPKLDGFALLGELRKVAPASQVPAVAVSSSMQLRTAASGLRKQLGITEIAASGMVSTTLRTIFLRALASGPKRAPVQVSMQAESARPSKQPLRSSEPSRLERIRTMGLIDNRPPDPALVQLVEETARTLGVPMAFLSIVLGDRQWFKAHFGLTGELLSQRGMPLDQSFCRHVIDAEVAAPLIVPEAKHHPVFSGYELVRRGAIGGYAGAPLMTADGVVLGTLCILDTKPLTIGSEQVDQLVAFARRAAGELEVQASKKRPSLAAEMLQDGLPSRGMEYIEAVLCAFDDGVVLFDAHREIAYVNPALAEMVGRSQHELLGVSLSAFVEHLATLSDAPDDLRLRVNVAAEGPFMARDVIEIARPTRRVLRWVAKPVQLPHGAAQLSVYTDITRVVVPPSLEDDTIFIIEEDEG